MTLSKRSRPGIFLRQVLRKLLIWLSVALEPLRARMRDNALRRVSTASPLVDPVAGDQPPLVVLVIYRARNVRLVKELLRHVDPRADVRLWALDEVAPELSEHTVGSGPGTRFSNLNRLYLARPVNESAWLVVADDDVLFVRGSLAQSIRVMRQAGFSLAQPGQSWLGWWTSLFNVAKPLLVARETDYVEQGPLLIVEPTFVQHVFPLPDKNDMGWGVEAEWYRAKEGRFRVGVIDSCRVVHWDRSATTYPTAPEMVAMKNRLARSGVDSVWQLQRVNGYWWKWQPSPSWVQSP